MEILTALQWAKKGFIPNDGEKDFLEIRIV